MYRSLGIASLVAVTALAANSFAQLNFDSGIWNLQDQLQLLDAQFHTGGSYLGVQLSDIDADRAATLKLGDARGVEIRQVEPGSPAEDAGLKAGDVLLSYNGENILGAQQLGRLVSETPSGRKIRVQYWRDGKGESTIVTTAEPRPRVIGIPAGSMAPSRFDMPELRSIMIPDIPTPLLVWKNSMLGIQCEPLDAQLAGYFGVKRGVLVRSVDKGGPGDKAGVKAGDVITSMGDHGIGSPRDFTSFTRSEHQPVRNTSVELVRDHKTLKLNVPVNDTP
jgi:serine protease Do